MDTSDQYIKMCKAKEIQDLWKRLPGDWVKNEYAGIFIFNRHTSLPEYDVSYTKDGKSMIMTQEEWNKEHNIWIPRLDQLIEILSDTHLLGGVIEFFYDFYDPERSCLNNDEVCKECSEKGIMRRTTFKTMEQLMLAFVMSEKFCKTWDKEKEDWI